MMPLFLFSQENDRGSPLVSDLFWTSLSFAFICICYLNLITSITFLSSSFYGYVWTRGVHFFTKWTVFKTNSHKTKVLHKPWGDLAISWFQTLSLLLLADQWIKSELCGPEAARCAAAGPRGRWQHIEQQQQQQQRRKPSAPSEETRPESLQAKVYLPESKLCK